MEREADTRVVPLPDDPNDPAWQAVVDDIRQLLGQGRLVAVPTETVYGLAGRGLDEDVVRSIYQAKGRPADNPVILHVCSLEDAWPLWDVDDVARARIERLAAAFWPGPLTMVATASDVVPPVTRAGLPKVAVRVPGHPFARALARALQEPFAAPSANLSGRPSPTTAEHVLETLRGRIAAVVDGGACSAGLESSVVDVSGERPRLLRPGALAVLALKRVLPDLEVRGPGQAAHLDDASPGIRHRHYAPALHSVRLVAPAELSTLWPTTTGLILREVEAQELLRRLGPRAAFVAALPDDEDGYGRALYAALYRAERAGLSSLAIAAVPDAVPDADRWLAVRDRLARATT